MTERNASGQMLSSIINNSSESKWTSEDKEFLEHDNKEDVCPLSEKEKELLEVLEEFYQIPKGAEDISDISQDFIEDDFHLSYNKNFKKITTKKRKIAGGNIRRDKNRAYSLVEAASRFLELYSHHIPKKYEEKVKENVIKFLESKPQIKYKHNGVNVYDLRPMKRWASILNNKDLDIIFDVNLMIKATK